MRAYVLIHMITSQGAQGLGCYVRTPVGLNPPAADSRERGVAAVRLERLGLGLGCHGSGATCHDSNNS